VAGGRKSVFGGHFFGPFLCPSSLNFDRFSATSADQVMVVTRGAGPVQSLAILRLQGIRLACRCKVGQGAIYRRQTDGRTVVSQNLMQLLGANKPDGFAQGVPHGIALPGVSALQLSHCGLKLVVFVVDVVFFIELFVQLRQKNLLPDGAIEQPDQDHVLNDGPTHFGQNVCRVGEDCPNFLPEGKPCVVHGPRLRLIENYCQ
jgi:hypothetical protein